MQLCCFRLMWMSALMLCVNHCNRAARASTLRKCNVLEGEHSAGEWRTPNGDTLPLLNNVATSSAAAKAQQWSVCEQTLQRVTASHYCHARGHEPVEAAWHVRDCALPQDQDGMRLLKALRNRRLLLVGDSIMAQLYFNLRCDLERDPSVDMRVERSRFHGMTRVANVAFGDSPIVPRASDGSNLPRRVRRRKGSSSGLALHFDNAGHDNATIDLFVTAFGAPRLRSNHLRRSPLRLDFRHAPRWIASADDVAEERRTVLLFNVGTWFSRTKLRTMDIAQNISSEIVFSAVMQSLFERFEQFRGTVFVRSIASAHKSGCDAPERRLVQRFGWDEFSSWNDVLRDMCAKASPHIHYLDIHALTTARADGHPSSFPEFAASGAARDCVHWCSPGPTSVVNLWSSVLIAALEAT